MGTVGVVGLRVENRADKADEVQQVITRYGDSILSRMGVPSPDRYTGLITITMESDQQRVEGFIKELSNIEGVTAGYCML